MKQVNRVLILAVLASSEYTAACAAEPQRPAIQTSAAKEAEITSVQREFVHGTSFGTPASYFSRISTLDDINSETRKKLLDRLKERVGAAYFDRLSFVDGEAVDLALAKAKRPPELKWELYAYRLDFRITNPAPGIKSYKGSVEYRQNGEIMRAEFPDIAQHPERGAFVPLSCAIATARSNGLTPDHASINFDVDRDIIVFAIDQKIGSWSGETHSRGVIVNAHNCEKVSTYAN